MMAAMGDYLQVNGIGRDAYPVKGHFLPVGDFRPVPGRGAVMLAGDAAGLVDPVTGEGIAHAMESGHFAALSAADAIRAGRPQEATGLYRARLKEIHMSLRMARWIRPVIYASLLQQTFSRSFRTSSTLKKMYLQVLAGETGYPALFRAVLLRVPRLAARAVLGAVRPRD